MSGLVCGRTPKTGIFISFTEKYDRKFETVLVKHLTAPESFCILLPYEPETTARTALI